MLAKARGLSPRTADEPWYNYTYSYMFKLDLDGPTRPKVYFIKLHLQTMEFDYGMPGRGAQSVAPLTQESEVPGSKFGSATYFRFTFR